MKYRIEDYTFWGLFNKGVQVKTPIDTLAYLPALVNSAQNDIIKLDKAKFVLRCLFDVEEQVESTSELLSAQEKICPKGYYPQTPVMLTSEWSPVAALLERGWSPLVLTREDKGMACASGVWEIKAIEEAKPIEQCETPEELFCYILERIVDKARERNLLLSLIANPGWSYEDNIGTLINLTLAEAQEADRVLWQRTPEHE